MSSEIDYKKRIFTIPNLLSLFRICMIPLIIWIYLMHGDYLLTGILVIISGITDVVDGFIARKFNMTSDLGKVLDPAADKLTQAVVILLIAIRFPLTALPMSLGIAKEIFMAVSGYMIIRRRGIVLGADWHGKAATFLLTATMVTHIVWYNIDAIASAALITLSSLGILCSMILYSIRNYQYLFAEKT